MSSFSQFAEWLGMNPWLSIASLIIALLSMTLAIIFYIKSKKIKSPYYAVRSSNLVRNLVSSIKSLEMLYSGQPIVNLTATKVAFWNAGRDTINGQDIASADPLAVHVKKGCKILDAKVLYTKNPANQFSVTTADDRSYITIQFDYVDKDEGVVIQLFHTGRSSDDIEISGKIKGAGEPIHKFVPTRFPLLSLTSSTLPIRKRRHISAILMFIAPILMIALFFLTPETSVKPESTFIPRIIVSVFVLITYWGLGFYLIKRRIPRGFEVFEEKF